MKPKAIARLLNSRLLLWALLLAPAIWLLWRWANGASTYGEAVRQSGIWGAVLLVPTTAVTPLRLLFGSRPWTLWLADRRGDIGLASFTYAGTHAAAYVIGKNDLELILREAGQLWLLAGWAALVIFLTFAATAEDAAVQFLRRSWRWLHRFEYASSALVAAYRVLGRWHRVVYLGAALVFVHWALSAFDPLTLRVQTALKVYGYYSGPMDGIIGPRSHDALGEFQRDFGLSVTRTITPEVLDVLGIVPN